MSGVAALAEFKDRIESMFLNENAINQNGIYAVNMYYLGVPHTVVIDDWLAYDEYYKNTTFARVGKDGSIWGPILEKAFAKFHGNYHHLQGGDPAYSVRTLTGAPYRYIKHKDHSAAEIWAELSSADSEKDVIQMGTEGAGDDSKRTADGLAKSHAYTVIGVNTLSDNT